MSAPSAVGTVRVAASAAALVLAVLSRGDALVLAALLVVVSWRPPALALLPALVGLSWRWGSTSLEAWAGAQAVLGPAGAVGPARSAAACWLAALTVVLAAPAGVGGMGARWGRMGAPNRGDGAGAAGVGGMGARWGRMGAPNLGWVASGAASAAVVAGPAIGGAVWVRVAATAVGAGVALAVGRARQHHALARRVEDGLGVVTGIGAVALASADAPAWAGTVDGSALATGGLLAAAVAAVVVVATGAVDVRRLHRA